MTELRQPGDSELVRYLLGEDLPEDQLDQIEESYFLNAECLERIAKLEAQLIEARAAGRLAAREESLFDTHFLRSPRRRRMWEAYSGRGSKWGSWFAWWQQQAFAKWPVATAGAVLFCVLIGSGYGIWRRDARRSQASARPAQLQQNLEEIVPAFVLSPGVLKGGAGQEVAVPKGARSVLLQLKVLAGGSAEREYEVRVTTVEGAELWRQGGLRGGTQVEATVPANVLTPGDYVIALSVLRDGMWQPLPSYVVRVTAGSAR